MTSFNQKQDRTRGESIGDSLYIDLAKMKS